MQPAPASSNLRAVTSSPRTPAPVRGLAAALGLWAADASKWSTLRNYPLFQRAVTTPIPRWLEPLGAGGALRAAFHAYRRVPAYKDFVDDSGWQDDRSLSGAERLALLPVMDKQSYIQRYSTSERCLDGRLPLVGTEMDESSGSSGTPYNWVRGSAELDEVHRQLSQFGRYVFKEPVVTINCFSMGAWSTGMNTAQALHRNGLVKSPGPDPERVLNTLRFLGPEYLYVITGYPPFLRELLEYGEAEGMDWGRYRMYGIVGGEGMSEQLRERLLEGFMSVFSAYGASDLDIGVAAETPLSVWVRRHAADNSELRRQLFGDDPRLPMLFQYNAVDYHVETVDTELVMTVSRLSMLSPRIRYNIHDGGGGHSFDDLFDICRDFGLDPRSIPGPHGRPHIRLPFLYVHGRTDATISYMGANIYPEDVEQALLGEPAIADRTGALCLELVDVGGGAVRPCVHVELTRPEGDNEGFASSIRSAVVARLAANSRDYRNAMQEDASTADLVVRLHAPGTGPFSENSRRIKRRYIVAAS